MDFIIFSFPLRQAPIGAQALAGEKLREALGVFCLALAASVSGAGALDGDDAFYKCTGLTTICFQGSMTQWSDVTKGLDWAQNTPSSLEIICTDGTLSK